MAKMLMMAAMLMSAGPALAQGQDSTTAERDVMVIAELLPGAYDNREQVYFDQRGGVPKEKQHNRMHEIVARVDLPAFGPFVFFIQDSRDNKLDAPTRLRLYTFSTDKADPDRVRMRIWQLDDVARYRDAHKNPAVLADLAPATTRFAEGCDVFWKREAGQFKAATDPATCRITIAGKKVTGEYQIQLSADARALWVLDRGLDRAGKLVAGHPEGVPHKMLRIRDFQCHIDMPGVSGGRAEPVERYGPFPTVDQGGEIVFMTKEATPREMHVTLRNVDWQINNEHGAFTRDVMVMYLYSKKADGKLESYGYTFTEPTVKRVGLNLGWMMVQCYMESNRSGKPEF
ncbi:MAG: hypothetical protein FJX59_03955 [Alphaproteobacteria bacterium]|nr:hypothetical protein [Alphaproteobacteria bacterium]